ncbi:MAG: preprotein translocase subunit SecA [Clostridia bacterium]
MGLFDTLLGISGESRIRKLRPILGKINALEPGMQSLSDADLRAKTQEFKDRLSKGETLDDILIEAFAAAREAAVRTVGERPFDVQILGGIVLHQGRIAEMKTGEGKTLVATLPSYLNALSGKGVHIVTVNDYLAKRDAQWMGKVHKFMGLTVGCIVHDMDNDERREAYNCDITYGTNNEFGFDYLRDNMVVYRENMVQRELNYAIVDEVDSILIDEARTPLIISGEGDKSTDMYGRADRFVCRLERGANIEKRTKTELLMGEDQPESGDYMVDIKSRTVNLTQDGLKKAEEYFGVEDISSPDVTELNHHIQQALKAHALFYLDKDYVVQDGEVLIVDEFTGRLMIGRRYSDGLHQALEAKEGVKIENENKTLATITFQNYFRMFKKLSGMTGTAKTEEAEFQSIYDLDVVEIPTNRPLIRVDNNDAIYSSEVGKFRAVVKEIEAAHKTGQPVLVGTISVEKSEMLSEILLKKGIKHEVLNAKLHAKEAEIVAQAGKFAHVTISTNMAGRGTNILLGGNPDFLARKELKQKGLDDEIIEEATGHAETKDEAILEARRSYYEAFKKFKLQTDEEHDKVVSVGGLYIIGTERHESRRIDNQLRGRAGRQGDPGSTRFFVSLDDELMQRFGADRVKGLMERLMPEDDSPIEVSLITKQIENAQKRVETHNFEIRKNVLQYDDVMNKMREIVYGQRRRVLLGEDISDSVREMVTQAIDERIHIYCPEGTKSDTWDLGGLISSITELCLFKPKCVVENISSHNELKNNLLEEIFEAYAEKEKIVNDAGHDMREIERVALLRSVDTHWMDHIDAMDQLRQGIGLRAFGQKDPVVEYRNEGFNMFDEMIASIRETTVKMLYSVNVRMGTERVQVAKPIEPAGDSPAQPARSKKKVGRNDPCPCGSGKKYKNCCGGN